MEALADVRAKPKDGSLERWLDEQNERLKGWKPGEAHKLDSPKMKKLQQRLLEWYHQEREKQAPNRYQMALDADFYDNLQWDEEDAAELRERGQAPLVFNVVASTVDWIIGTEKRNRVDFKVLPRAEDDVQNADAKTKTLKYLSDVNKTAYYRSLAFADAVKVGVGWVEDAARGDPTEEPVYSGYENWRNVLWDSSGNDRAGRDWRYEYRWKWIDLDIAEAIWPDRRAQLQRAAVAANMWGSEEDEDFWYLGQHFQARGTQGEVIGRRNYASDSALVNNRRARVKIIECWYRIPQRCLICRGEAFNGQPFDKSNDLMRRAALEGAINLVEQITMRVRVALMTENDLLAEQESPYRHNRFPLTPIWCYIRGRDRMPYGVIRRVRDPQEDLNKRASKALFEASTNRVIADHDALDGTGLTWDDMREEVARPDMLATLKKGSRFEIVDNTERSKEHLHLMDRNERMIQHAGGITDDNLGRRTNATSGEAIKARQLQGSVVTAEIFDNERFAIQTQGEIQLSLAEQFISEPKVIRLVGARGDLDFVKLNEPEVQSDGSVRFLNDITATKADFVVDQQDFHQNLRQAMFDSMTDLVGRIAAFNAEAALRILRMALEFSDLPNKDEMAGEIKSILGLVDEEDLERMTPDELAEHQRQQEERAEAEQLQKQAAVLEVAKLEGEVNKLQAEAERLLAQADELRASMGAEGLGDDERAAIDKDYRSTMDRYEKTAAAALEQAREMIEKLQQQNRTLEVRLADKSEEIQQRHKTTLATARIGADAKVKTAKITAKAKPAPAAAAKKSTTKRRAA
jgi:hypothetical protein